MLKGSIKITDILEEGTYRVYAGLTILYGVENLLLGITHLIGFMVILNLARLPDIYEFFSAF
jgi:hypothetical protein